MNKERLLNVIRAIKESPNPEKFEMERYAFDCNTPACALGHYAARQDLQNEYRLHQFQPTSDSRHNICIYNVKRCEHASLYDFARHFDITYAQAEELFDSAGCNKAATTDEAITFIEAFIARHENKQ